MYRRVAIFHEKKIIASLKIVVLNKYVMLDQKSGPETSCSENVCSSGARAAKINIFLAPELSFTKSKINFSSGAQAAKKNIFFELRS